MPMNKQSFQQPKTNRGYTLIEVLVAVIILSVGLLGTLSLQLLSKRGNFEAMQRTQATMLANAVIDRMRANPGSVHEVLDCYAQTDLGTGISSISDCSAGSTGRYAAANADRLALHNFTNELGGTGSTSGALVTPVVCITHNDGTNVSELAGLGNVRVVVAWRGITERAKSGSTYQVPLADTTCGASAPSLIDAGFRKMVVIDTYIGASDS